MRSRFLFVFLTLAFMAASVTLAAGNSSSPASFYDNPENQFYYPYHKHEEKMGKFLRALISVRTNTNISNETIASITNASYLRLTNATTESQPAQTYNSLSTFNISNNATEDSQTSNKTLNKADSLKIRVIDGLIYLLDCTFNGTSSILSCKNDYRSFQCEKSFDISDLNTFSYIKYDLYSFNYYQGMPSHYQVLSPFKLVANLSSSDCLVYDYSIPIRDLELKLTLTSGEQISSHDMEIKEISCFNRFVLALNEAKHSYAERIQAELENTLSNFYGFYNQETSKAA